MRRNPLPHEVQASVDYEAMEQAWTTERASLVEQGKADVKTAHVAALVEAIQESDTLDQLAALEAPVLGEELLGDAMFTMAEEAGSQAVAEAAAQGVELDLPWSGLVGSMALFHVATRLPFVCPTPDPSARLAHPRAALAGLLVLAWSRPLCRLSLAEAIARRNCSSGSWLTSSARRSAAIGFMVAACRERCR